MENPQTLYSVIYADPPWKFTTYSDKGKGRSAEAWYDCLTLDEIKNIPVKQWAAHDCVLLMWVTDPFLFKSKEVLDAWGFEYKTVGFVWAKTNELNKEFFMGTGYWTRANPEHCLLATRGHPKRVNSDVRELVISPRREHSRKPDEMYSLIERLCAGPYLELFARNMRDGWDCLGKEAETGIGVRRWKSNNSSQNAPLQTPPPLSDFLP